MVGNAGALHEGSATLSTVVDDVLADGEERMQSVVVKDVAVEAV